MLSISDILACTFPEGKVMKVKDQDKSKGNKTKDAKASKVSDKKSVQPIDDEMELAIVTTMIITNIACM